MSRGLLRKLLVASGLIAVLVVAMQGVASAHAVVTEIEPDPDAVLGSAPARVRIDFNEPVSVTENGIRVFDPAGSEVAGLRTTAKDTEISAELPTLAEQGSYTVSWKVISADGHAIDGAFLFSIGKASLSEPLDVVDSSGGITLPRVVRTLGGIVAWGGLVMILHTLAVAAHAGYDRRRINTGAALTVVGATASLAGSLMLVGGPLSTSLRVTTDTTSGLITVIALFVSIILTGVVIASTRGSGRLEDAPRRTLVVIALVTVVVMSLEGHAVALSPVVVSAVGTVLHVVAAIVWLAGLLWIDRRSRLVEVAELRENVAARSPQAMVAVVVLTVTGVGMFALRIPPDELISSAYGLLGGAKIIVLAMALVLAWQNRSTMSPVVVDDGSAATNADEVKLAQSHRDAVDIRRFRSSLRVEAILVAVALVLGVVLAQVSPPGEDGAAGGGYFAEKVTFGDGKVELTVDPSRRGVNEMHVTATGPDGRLMEGVEDLKLSFYLDEKDFGPLQPSLQVISAGHSYTFARIPFAGDWTVRITATVDRFEQLEATVELPIGG